MAGILGHRWYQHCWSSCTRNLVERIVLWGEGKRFCPSVPQNPHRSSLRIWLGFLEYADPTDLPGTLQVTIVVKGAGSCWAIRSKEALIYVTTWTSLEIIMLSKGS